MSGNIKSRIGGLICLAVAAGFGWFLIWQPLQEAQRHAPQVEYSLKAFVLVPFAAVFGVFFLLFGDSIPYRNARTKKFTSVGWLVVIIAALAAGLSFWWFQAQFAALGYNDTI